jgi:hypothetical protein
MTPIMNQSAIFENDKPGKLWANSGQTHPEFSALFFNVNIFLRLTRHVDGKRNMCLFNMKGLIQDLLSENIARNTLS